MADTSYDMKINAKKTKDVRVSKTGEGLVTLVNIVIDGVRVEQLDRLGSMITAGGRRESEITIIIGMAKDACGKRKKLLAQKIKLMNKNLKKRIITTIVWWVALYGAKK